MSSSMEQATKTPNKGKRKIPIEPITNKTRKQVTFSKRRGGLFKKGSELSSLCGAQVAIITFSGAGKFFGFGHPNAESVVQRYINSSKDFNNNSYKFNCDNGNGIDRGNDLVKFSQEYKDVIGQIEAEKRCNNNNSSINIINNEFGNININNNARYWWDENIDELGLADLEHYKLGLEGLRNEVVMRVDEINRSSMGSMGSVAQNVDFDAREGNTVAHFDGLDLSQSQGNDQGQGQGFGGPGYGWIDHGMGPSGRENYHSLPLPMHMPVPVDSLLDMLDVKMQSQ